MLKIENERLCEIIIGDTLPDKEDRQYILRVNEEVFERFLRSKGIAYQVYDYLDFITVSFEYNSALYELTVFCKKDLSFYEIQFSTPRLADETIYERIVDVISNERNIQVLCSVFWDEGKGPVEWRIVYTPDIEVIPFSVEGVEAAFHLLTDLSQKVIISRLEKAYLESKGFSYAKSVDVISDEEGEEEDEGRWEYINVISRNTTEGRLLSLTYNSSWDACLKQTSIEQSKEDSNVTERRFYGITELDEFGEDVRRYEIIEENEKLVITEKGGMNNSQAKVEMEIGQVGTLYHYCLIGIHEEPAIICLEEEGSIKFFLCKVTKASRLIAEINGLTLKEGPEDTISVRADSDYTDYIIPILLLKFQTNNDGASCDS